MHCALKIRPYIACLSMTAALVAWPGPGRADSGQELPRTLAEAFDQARWTRIDIRQAESKITTAALNKALAKSALYPQIGFGLNVGTSHSAQPAASNWNQGASLSISYSLYTGGTEALAIEGASLRQRDAELERLQVLKRALEDVASAFYQLQLALLQEQADKVLLPLGQHRLDSLETAVRNGTVGRNAYQNAVLQQQQQQLQAQKNRLDTENYRLALCKAIGQLPCPQLREQYSIDDAGDVVPDYFIELASQVRQAIDTRMEIARKLSAQNVERARSAYLPRVSVGASASTSGSSSNGFGEMFQNTQYNGWGVSFSLNWTLFDGMRTATENKLARQSLQDTGLSIDQQLAQVAQEQQTAELAWRQAELACQTTLLKWKQAQADFEQEKVRHKVGNIGLDAMLQAQQKQDEAALMLRRQAMDLHSARFKLIASGQQPPPLSDVQACDPSVIPLIAAH